MTALLQLGFALLLSSIMFFSPIGCAQSMPAAKAPAHPCCPSTPSPVPPDCGRPGCAYIEAKPIIIEAPLIVHYELDAVTETPDALERTRGAQPSNTLERTSLTRDRCYLTFHQLLL